MSESVKERAYKCVRVSARVRESERQSEEAESRSQEYKANTTVTGEIIRKKEGRKD